MTKILLLSDTHGYFGNEIIPYALKADEIWHAGDIGALDVIQQIQTLNKPIRAVYGNIDDAAMRKDFPLHQEFTCEDVSVWITHIGGYPPAYTPVIKNELLKKQPKLFICGHSHILKVQYDKVLNILHMNPGAIGKHGFHQVRTMLQFIIDGSEIKDLSVIEFPR